MNQDAEALIYLEVAYAQHDGDLPSMLLRPMFEPLYQEPRFLDLVTKTGVALNVPIMQ